MEKLGLIGIGGFAGSVFRYLMQGLIHKWTGPGFPYGTFVVNILGCFFIGLIMTLSEERFLISQNLRIFLTVGLLGGFTTFSSFSYESYSLFQQGEYLYVAFNTWGSIIFGLLATWCGAVLARLF